ncbi:hypothetical protein [Zunongwangia sp.]|uniref:hypothetical protein n=1 Tax=Zunongwangia sp. TaxID=1965325 RepID=UPI003AA8D491
MKVKSSSLYIVLVIGVLIVILLGGFLLLVKNKMLFNSKISNVSDDLKSLDKSILTYPKLSSTVSVNTDYWGAFTKIEATNKELTKDALLLNAKDSLVPSIYLEDHNSPLVIAGGSQIAGVVKIPKGYWKLGAISGNYFRGTLTKVNQVLRSQELPVLDSKWRKYIKKILNSNRSNYIGNYNMFFKSRTNIFDKPTLYYSSDQGTYLQGQYIGNIIIKDNVEIEVSKEADLRDVLLVAPKIVIADNFKGNIHCITNEISVGKNVRLIYPSSICALEKKTRKKKIINNWENIPDIKVGNNTFINGPVIFLKENTNDDRKANIQFEKGSKIIGDIYCEGYTELRGSVIGSVYTSYFIYTHQGSKYINYLFDANIDSNFKISRYSGGLPFASSGNYILASWLY